MIFSAYRRDDYADAESFVLQLGMVLERYSDEVIAHVCHPATGIQRRCKFPPSIAEIVEACDAEAASIATAARYAAMGPITPRAQIEGPREPCHLGNVLVHRAAPQYQAMVDRAAREPQPSRYWRWDEKGRGIWVAIDWVDDASRTKLRRFTAADLQAAVAAE